MILLDEPLDGVALLGVGRKLEELDILGVTLTMIKARQRGINSGMHKLQYCIFTFTAYIPCCVYSGCFPFTFATSSSMIQAHLNGASEEQMNSCSIGLFDAP